MGKGAGNCLAKPQEPAAATRNPLTSVAPPPVPAPVTPPVADPPKPKVIADVPVSVPKQVTTAAALPSKMTKIYVIYYSMYGHNLKMAQAIKDGLETVPGVEVTIYQVPETLPEEVLAKMHAPPKADYPVITAADLPHADGLVFGFPTRFGMPVAQMQAFWNSTGGLWQSGALVGKPATCFTSTATPGGGMETTIMTAVPFFVHQGMVFVPPGYSQGAAMFAMDSVKAGSPWGAGTFAGIDGSRQPSEGELAYAKHQGSFFGNFVKKLTK